MALFGRLKQMLHHEDDDGNKTELNNGDILYNQEESFGKQLSNTSGEKNKQTSTLTPREYDLFLLLLEGFTLKECAKKLSIKYSTANTHMTGVYKKLGVKSRAELIIHYRNVS